MSKSATKKRSKAAGSVSRQRKPRVKSSSATVAGSGAVDPSKEELQSLNVDERTKQLQRLAFERARAEESERRAIARDLHDDLGQLLAVAKLKLTKLRAGDGKPAAEQVIAEVVDLIARAEGSIRSLAFQLSPPVLYELGLIPALQWLAEEMKKTYGLSVEVSDDAREKPLSQAARAIVFRAIRELLINVVRHAGVSKAYVSATRVGEGIEVAVTDDGNGFDSDTIAAQSGAGFGLTSVRERLSFIGGSVDISSMQGDGTEVTLRVPLQTGEKAAEESAESRKGKNA